MLEKFGTKETKEVLLIHTKTDFPYCSTTKYVESKIENDLKTYERAYLSTKVVFCDFVRLLASNCVDEHQVHGIRVYK